tara:strand:+ start:2631 stop:2855 length:225 start_codon:yes stop_codon:yes gene_type:complete
MKKSQLHKLIKEEVSKALKEDRYSQIDNIKSMLQRKVDDYFLAFEEGFEPEAYENATIKDILADFMEYAMASND